VNQKIYHCIASFSLSILRMIGKLGEGVKRALGDFLLKPFTWDPARRNPDLNGSSSHRWEKRMMFLVQEGKRFFPELNRLGLVFYRCSGRPRSGTCFLPSVAGRPERRKEWVHKPCLSWRSRAEGRSSTLGQEDPRLSPPFLLEATWNCSGGISGFRRRHSPLQ